MLPSDNRYNRIIVFLLVAFLFSCKERSRSQSLSKSDSLIVNCFKTKPVKNDSKADSLRDFDFSGQTLDDFLSASIDKRSISYDSAMDYITSFDYQKIISINHICFKKIVEPDSSNLIDIYFNSEFATWVKKRSTVQFIQSYKKHIYNFGNATIFEYRFNNVAEVEPHFMYIILKEQTEDEQRYGKDHKGFVICSGGLSWKDYSDKGFSIPLFTQMVRRSKEFFIPLYYDGDRFIPIGHFKSSNWQD